MFGEDYSGMRPETRRSAIVFDVVIVITALLALVPVVWLIVVWLRKA